jgi:hypothetical protein
MPNIKDLQDHDQKTILTEGFPVKETASAEGGFFFCNQKKLPGLSSF